MRGFSRCVCGHDKMKAKTNNTINDPLGVGALIFKVRRKILRDKKVQKVREILLVSNQSWGI